MSAAVLYEYYDETNTKDLDNYLDRVITNEEKCDIIGTELGMENGVFCTIEWSLYDLINLFESYDIPLTRENVKDLLDTGDITGRLEDFSISEGWEYLNDIVQSFSKRKREI